MKQAERIEKDLGETVDFEQVAKFEGKQIIMVVAPKK